MNTTYIIGEIGQNHNGSVDIAKLIIDLVSRTIEEDTFHIKLRPIDAVKLTKRDLSQELSKSQMDAPYNSPNSFGRTYGEHRAFLELNDEQHLELYQYAKSKGIDFVETLCAIGCLSLLKLFTPDFLKVASRDLTNWPLLEAMAETKIPIILSTGMAGKEQLEDALSIIEKYHSKISVLHCVSQYPTEPKNVNLLTIAYLKKHFPQYTIGYSDHTIGIATPLAAVAMGEKKKKKHVTIDRRMKGTDQLGSLGPDGVNRMIRDIRLFEISQGVEDIYIEPSVSAAKNKLERSIASNRFIKKGEVIQDGDLHLLSPGDGIKWSDKEQVIGSIAKSDIPANEIIYPDLLKKSKT